MINQLNRFISFCDRHYIWGFILILFFVILFLLGCATKVVPASVPPQTAAEGALVKLVDQNWLVTLSFILCITGVYTFINGGNKGVALLGAGLAGIALAGLIAAFFAILADYKGIILLVLGALTVVGVIAFVISSADLNSDGKINLQDLKDLFRKKK